MRNVVVVIFLAVSAHAAVAKPLPEVGLATVFARVDKTGAIEKMAGEKFYCLNRPVDATTFGVAHRTLPCGTMVLIVNIRNGKTVRAPVIDRGPYWVVPRACSRSALGRWPSHECWAKGRSAVRLRGVASRKWARANVVDVTVPVARALRLRGKEPVVIYPLPRGRYNW